MRQTNTSMFTSIDDNHGVCYLRVKYGYTQLTAKKRSTIEKEWKKAVESSNNRKIKQLFMDYGQNKFGKEKIDFTQIMFENGDNSLHYAARRNNLKLCRLLIILKIDVCVV